MVASKFWGNDEKQINDSFNEGFRLKLELFVGLTQRWKGGERRRESNCGRKDRAAVLHWQTKALIGIRQRRMMIKQWSAKQRWQFKKEMRENEKVRRSLDIEAEESNRKSREIDVSAPVVLETTSSSSAPLFTLEQRVKRYTSERCSLNNHGLLLA